MEITLSAGYVKRISFYFNYRSARKYEGGFFYAPYVPIIRSEGIVTGVTYTA